MPSKISFKKRFIAQIFKSKNIVDGFQKLQNLRKPYIRAFNYHDVPPRFAEAFESQLLELLENYIPVGLEGLQALLSGQWPYKRPGIILSFDDGLRCHAEVCAPILERHQVPGWFFLPVGFLDCPIEGQRRYIDEHRIACLREEWTGGALAMSWDQARDLSKRHILGGHTWNHRRAANIPLEALNQEIRASKERMELELGRRVESFAWVGAEPWSYTDEAQAALLQAGYRYLFTGFSGIISQHSSPHQLCRSQLEVDFPPEIQNLQRSGLMDLLHLYQRRNLSLKV